MSRKLAVCLAVAIAVTSVIGDSAFAEKKERGNSGRTAERRQPREAPPAHHAPPRRGPEHDKHGPGGGWGDYFGPSHDRAPDLERVLDLILRRQDKDEDRAKLGSALNSLIHGSGSSRLDDGYHGSYRNRYGRLDLNTAINHEIRKQELLEDRRKLGDALKSLIKDASSGEKCTTQGVSSYSPGYCPPGYTPVVLEAAPSYYRYVNCD